MQIDTIRAIATYIIALVVVVGGFAIIFASRADQSATDTRIVIAGFVGVALQFVFGQEVSTRSARATTAATIVGQQQANGH